MISGEYTTSAAKTRSRSLGEEVEFKLDEFDERTEEKESNSPLGSMWPQISSWVLILGFVVS